MSWKHTPKSKPLKRMAWLGVLALIIAMPLIILGRGGGEQDQQSVQSAKAKSAKTTMVEESLHASHMNNQKMMKAMSQCPVMSGKMEASFMKAETADGCGSCPDQNSSAAPAKNVDGAGATDQSANAGMPDHCKDKMAGANATSDHCEQHEGMAADMKDCPMHEQSAGHDESSGMMKNCPMHAINDTVDAAPQTEADDHEAHQD